VPEATPALELRDLCFRYGRQDAVRAVSLTLQRGDCYGFLGHNGAGKTTVMRLALGLLRPRSGTVRVFGIDALSNPREARASVGALVERPGFHATASARHNLAWLARLQGMPRRLALADADRCLDLLGLRGEATKPVHALSMGNRQRLGIAAALLGNPALLVLDEPSNGLDPEGIAELRRLLQRLVAGGTTVLVSSHQLLELDGLCNRVGVLRSGAMVLEGDLDSLRQRLGARHVVHGSPLPALAERLRRLGLAPVEENARLLVDLGARAPAAVVRELCAAGDVTAFAPEPATLEAIYLRATSENGLGTAPPAAPPRTAPEPASPPSIAAPRPRRRAFAHELRTMLARRTTVPLLLVPAAVALWSVAAYDRRIAATLDRVANGQLFSADAGSGFVAAAHALQAAVPALAAAAVFLASQSVAADLASLTLRNTVLRSVRRGDVAFGKLAALLVVVGGAFAALVGVTVAAAAATRGFVDLEEVSKHGDRQVLAATGDVAPVFVRSLLHCLLPLSAVTAIGLAVSALTKRPARALALGALAVLGPEVARDALRTHAGWLLTSHLPTGLRDDSALGFLAATARGAADAFWPWSGAAITTPLAWLAAAVAITWLVLRRLPVP